MTNNKKLIKRIYALILIITLAAGTASSGTAANAVFAGGSSDSGALELYDYSTKSTYTYNNAQLKYTYNGINVPLGAPGILSSNNVSLAPVYDVFQIGLGFGYKYDAGKITLTNGGNTMVMEIGSKTAYFNGEKMTLQAAPIRIKYNASGKSRVLVPSRNVAESFGYSYKWIAAESTVAISKTLKISYNKRTYTYTGTQADVSYNGKVVNVVNFPSVMISNVAMLRAYQVFVSSLGCSYNYNKSTKKITISKGDIVIEMKRDSTKCTINGKEADCGIAPRLIANKLNGKQYMFLPGRFIAESLGYSYTWSQAQKRSIIASTEKTGNYDLVYNSKQEEPSEEDVSKTYYSFFVDENKRLAYEKVIDNTVTEIDNADYSGIAAANVVSFNRNEELELSGTDEVTSELYFECYEMKFDSPVSKISSELTDDSIEVSFSNSMAVNKKYNFQGSLIGDISLGYSEANKSLNMVMKTNASYPYYDIKLLDDGKTARVIVYPNYLTGLTFGTDKYGDYIRFEGLTAFNYTYKEDDVNGQIIMSLENTANTLGNISFPSDLFEDYFVNAVLYETDPNRLELIVNAPKNKEKYKVVSDSVNLYLYFNYKEVIADTEIDDSKEEIEEKIDNTEIEIKLPEGVSFKDITTSDLYLSKKILVKIPGNYTSFYSTNKITNKYKAVESINVSYEDGYTVITFKTSKIQAFKLYDESENGSVYIKIANPKEIYDKIIVLDAGHGGIDPGAVANGYNEKDINYAVTNTYCKQVFENSGIKVYFTRYTDVKIDLYVRADFPTQVQADLFISVHQDSASAAANGTATYYSLVNTNKNSGGLSSAVLAQTLENKLVEHMNTKKNGVKTANFVVIRETKVPATLIELGFITSSIDIAKITSSTYQKKAADAIYEAVSELYKKYPVD